MVYTLLLVCVFFLYPSRAFSQHDNFHSYSQPDSISIGDILMPIPPFLTPISSTSQYISREDEKIFGIHNFIDSNVIFLGIIGNFMVSLYHLKVISIRWESNDFPNSILAARMSDSALTYFERKYGKPSRDTISHLAFISLDDSTERRIVATKGYIWDLERISNLHQHIVLGIDIDKPWRFRYGKIDMPKVVRDRPEKSHE
jgi:hypothetical protein